MGASGTPHFQFYIWFKSPVRISFLQKRIKGGHFEKVTEDNGASSYCLKEDTRVLGPWEFGEKPVRRNTKADWDAVRTLACAGELDKIPADIYIKHYRSLKQIEKDNITIVDKSDLRGVWIWGEAGVGKSRRARQDYPDHYPKLCNKWWDGYQGQKHVIMDDLAPEHKVLAQQLKIWADRYGVILETKGGAVTDKYEKFVITSQYSPEEVFLAD